MTKKEKAFKLFDEGKSPSSPEVKDFRLRSKRGTLPSGEAIGNSEEAIIPKE